jgi:hypothetical protein
MTYPTSLPSPTPECAVYEPLLPLLDTDALTPDELAAAQHHVAGCAWGRAQRAGYDAFEAALRRHYSAEAPSHQAIATRTLTLEDLMGTDDSEAIAHDDSELILEFSSIAPKTRSGRKLNIRRPRLMAEIAAVLVVALLAATLLVNRLGPLGGTLFQQSPLKTPAGAVVFTHSVSWGKLQLNGQTISVASNGDKPLYLPRGQNTLMYQAPPLPVLSCTISAPAAHGDTCPLMVVDGSVGWIDSSGNQLTNADFTGRIVDLKAVPAQLSQTQRDQFLTAVQRILGAYTRTTNIQPGAHYLTPEDKIVTATQSFAVTLSFHVDAAGIGPDMVTCMPHCDAPATSWSITPTVQLNYIDQYGNPETVLMGSSVGDLAIDVGVAWDGAWHITLDQGAVNAALCATIFNTIANLPSSSSAPGGGCVAPLSQDGSYLIEVGGRMNGASQDIIGYVLYRAGALMALDEKAHELVATLPRPSAHELAIAQALGFNE